MSWIAENYDKWLHFLIIGFVVAWWVVLSIKKIHLWIGFILCLVIASGKELVWDLWLGKGNPELLDFGATMILPLIGLFILTKIKKI